MNSDARGISSRALVSGKQEVLALLVLMMLAAAGSWLGSGMAVDAQVFPGREGSGENEVWFDADTEDALERLTAPGAMINAPRHPFEGLLMRAPVRLIVRLAPGADPAWLLRVLLSAAAALWAALLFTCFRTARCTVPDSLLFAALAIAGAASMFWFIVPDYFVVSAVTALPAMLVAARAGRLPTPEWVSMGAVVLSAAVTVTNGMFGAAASLVAHRWPRALQVLANGFCILVLLWHVQHAIYPAIQSPTTDSGYGDYLWLPDSHSPSGPLAAVFLHAMVMPEVKVGEVRAVNRAYEDGARGNLTLTVQSARPGSGGWLGLVALAAWIGILLIGAVSLWRGHATPALRNYLLIVTAGQVLLHLAFGVETFLYAPHFLPPLLMIGAAGTLGPWRRTVRALAGILLVCAALNNVEQLRRSFALAPPLEAARAVRDQV